MTAKKCAGCGSDVTGRFCAQCGRPSDTQTSRHCGACGAAAEPGALYCSDCGAPVNARPRKAIRARLPWILSALALVAFAVAISLMVGRSTAERAPGMPPTGGIIEGDAGAGPAAVDLASMSPREAADRLFERAMRTESGGDTTQAQFFARMAVQAYDMVPASQLDADARFHLGLLELLRDDPAAAATHADAIIGAAPDHLLGWILKGRIAAATGDAAAASEAEARFRSAVVSERASGRTEYAQHQTIIDDEVARLSIP